MKLSNLIPALRKLFTRKRTNAKHNGLEFAFTYKGVDYFQYGDRVELPVKRMGEIMRFQQLLSAGVTGAELRDLSTGMATEIAKITTIEPKKKEFTEAVARLNRLNSEILFRTESIVPTEILYNLLAATYIRQDENPLEWIWDIHLQKVETFMKISEQEHQFFFANAQLRASIAWLGTTQENWTQFLRESKANEMWTKSLLTHISSWPESGKIRSGEKTL